MKERRKERWRRTTLPKFPGRIWKWQRKYLNIMYVAVIFFSHPQMSLLTSICFKLWTTFSSCTHCFQESKRAESLMSLHTKKMKDKANEDADKPVERRPFDRDMDLQVNRFDEAQKKRLLKKSQELNTRFSHSKDRMFL